MSAAPIVQASAEVVREHGGELMFVEALRRYAGSLPPQGKGWPAGLRDVHVGRALALLHGDPRRPWTVDDLAREVALSRSGAGRPGGNDADRNQDQDDQRNAGGAPCATGHKRVLSFVPDQWNTAPDGYKLRGRNRLAIAAPIDMIRDQTRGEEIANAMSHGIGCLLAIAALPILANAAALRGPTAEVVAANLFTGTMIVLYLVSTLYHAMPSGRAKNWLYRLDHASIYLFIAGSYMPFLFGVLRGAWGWSLFAVVWTAAVFGITAKLFDRLKHPLWSTGLYVAMGWVALIAAAPLFDRMSSAGLIWLVAGGFFYTAGAVIYLFDSKLRYAHFVWHLFVMAGSSCHFCAAMWPVAT